MYFCVVFVQFTLVNKMLNEVIRNYYPQKRKLGTVVNFFRVGWPTKVTPTVHL